MRGMGFRLVKSSRPCLKIRTRGREWKQNNNSGLATRGLAYSKRLVKCLMNTPCVDEIITEAEQEEDSTQNQNP